MSNPSFDNIDKWLFELVEGNLSESQIAKLEQFILQNPGLESELDAWKLAKIEPVLVEYPLLQKQTRKPIGWLFSSTVVLISVLGIWSTDSFESNRILPNAKMASHKLMCHKIEIPKNQNPTIANQNTDMNFPTSKGIGNDSPTNFRTYGNFNLAENKIQNDHENKIQLNSSEPILIQTETESFTVMNEIDSVTIFENNLKPNPEITTEQNLLRTNSIRISSNYKKKSFTDKTRSLLRKITRMTDNPLALSNSKDIYYHVPGMQNMDVNFGSAGSMLRSRFQSVSRLQWGGTAQQQFTNQLSYDTYVKSIRGGFGVQVNHSYYGQGEFQVGQFAMIYSPKFVLNKNIVLEPAIRFKMGAKQLDNSKVVAGEMVELVRNNTPIMEKELENNSIQNLWYKDVGLGITSQTKWFSTGIQIDNLGRHFMNIYNSNEKFDRSTNHITATLGTDYVSRTKLFSISPYIMYQKVENLSEIWGGSIFRYKKFTLGAGLTGFGEFAGSIGFKTNQLMVTFNTDYTYSLLSNKRLFSQQLTIRILTNKGRYDQRMLNL